MGHRENSTFMGISTLWKTRKAEDPGSQPMFLKEFSMAVMVSDAKKTAKWFRDKLGFEVSVEGHWVTAWPTGSNSKLHLCEGKLEPGVHYRL
jgi:hypothetical protein